MPAALRIGHHFSISAFYWAASASGVCCSRGGIVLTLIGKSLPYGWVGQSSLHRLSSLVMGSLGVPFA
jgi:hypothetical protein